VLHRYYESSFLASRNGGNEYVTRLAAKVFGLAFRAVVGATRHFRCLAQTWGIEHPEKDRGGLVLPCGVAFLIIVMV